MSDIYKQMAETARWMRGPEAAEWLRGVEVSLAEHADEPSPVPPSIIELARENLQWQRSRPR